MPELPDIRIYVNRINKAVAGCSLEAFKLHHPFVLRTVTPSPDQFLDKKVIDVHRLGKRVVLQFDNELYIVIHLMVSGRLRFHPKEKKPNKRLILATLQFSSGTIHFTEASKKRRASIHLADESSIHDHQRSGIDATSCSFEDFCNALKSKNRTIKRALCDPSIIDGIGNAYSDEILHHAQMAPFKTTQRMSLQELKRVYESARQQLDYWTTFLDEKLGDNFPDKVTAFHPEMAAHGRFGKPCPRCGKPIQRVRYATNELNYCPICQTDGKLLSDRSLARLLKDSWPKKV